MRIFLLQIRCAKLNTNGFGLSQFIINCLIPGKILFVIMTDGMENASEKYDVTTIKSMIEQHKEKGWEFVFIGANIDAVEVGDTIGIDQDFSVSYKADRVGMKKNFDAIHCLANDIRFEKKISSAWKADIEEHNR